MRPSNRIEKIRTAANTNHVTIIDGIKLLQLFSVQSNKTEVR
jgi:hypothetical protein